MFISWRISGFQGFRKFQGGSWARFVRLPEVIVRVDEDEISGFVSWGGKQMAENQNMSSNQNQ